MSGIIDQIRLAMRSYRKAHILIRDHKLWGYVFLPGIINLMIFLATFYIAWQSSGILSGQIFDWLGISEAPSGDWLTLRQAFRFFLLLLIRLLFIILYVFIYKYIVLILMAPVLAILSEKTEEILTGTRYPFQLSRFIKDIIRGVLIAIRNMVIQFLILFICFWVSSIPVIGFITIIIAFLSECYFYGFSLLDYTNERHRHSVKESVKIINRNFSLTIGIGAGFYLLILIPLAGLLIAPAYSVVAATIASVSPESKTR